MTQKLVRNGCLSKYRLINDIWSRPGEGVIFPLPNNVGGVRGWGPELEAQAKCSDSSCLGDILLYIPIWTRATMECKEVCIPGGGDSAHSVQIRPGRTDGQRGLHGGEMGHTCRTRCSQVTRNKGLQIPDSSCSTTESCLFSRLCSVTSAWLTDWSWQSA